MAQNPEGTDEGLVGQLADESAEPQPSTQEPSATPEETPPQPQGTQAQQAEAPPDRWHGKSREEVIRMVEELESQKTNSEQILQELGQKYQAQDQYLRQLQSQQQVRTTGPDRQPSQVPQYGTPQQRIDLKTAQEKAYEGDYSLLEQYYAQQADDRVVRKLQEVVQANQAQIQTARAQKLAELDTVAEIGYGKVGAKLGVDPKTLKRAVEQELRYRPELLQELNQNPWAFDQGRIEEGIENLYKDVQKAKYDENIKFWKSQGLNFEQAKRLVEEQKQAAAQGVPQSGVAGESKTEAEYPEEIEQQLQRLGI